MSCELCASTEHEQAFHDAEILTWLSDDPSGGTSNMRSYYAYKRREKVGYKGLRADVWWMMHNSVTRW